MNLIADGPPAMTLGIDQPQPGVMSRRPVPSNAAILTGRRIGRLVFLGVVMAVGVLTMFVWARDRYGEDVALTMAFTAFVLQQMVNVFNSRTENGSVFCRYTAPTGASGRSSVVVVVLQVLATIWNPLQSLFGTEHLTGEQWGVAVLVALSVLVVEELRKVVARLLVRRRARAPIPEVSPR